jgi:predicted deacylase
VEVGGPRVFDVPKIRASIEGARNVLADYGITGGKVGRTAKDSRAFFGNDLEVIRSSTGGFVELLVKLGDKVTIGQKLAVQRNSFGDIREEFTSSVEGAVLGTDALREPGARLMEILVNRTDQKCVNGGCAYGGEDY